MSSIQDLSKLVETNSTQQGRQSLLSKYSIPITHFEFDYIEKCNDGKELESILLVLHSGEEGYFPHLEVATKNRLKVIKPKSKLLRNVTQVLSRNDLQKGDLDIILGDLNIWVVKVSKDDKELETRKSNRNQHDVAIRTSKEIHSGSQSLKDKKEKRISSTDFKAWDKYDPDTELLKMELEEEKMKQKAYKETNKSKKKKSVIINEVSTEAEANFLSDREREKGNEFFRNNDYDEALFCYTNSVALKPTIENINNQAAAYLKLLKYPECIADCLKVLKLDKGNMKAHWQLAEALEKIQNYEEALKHIEYVINQNPNNTQAQKLAERIRNNSTACLKNSRIQITEIN